MGVILRRVRTRPARTTGARAARLLVVGALPLFAVAACTSTPAADRSSSAPSAPSTSSSPAAVPSGSAPAASAPSTAARSATAAGPSAAGPSAAGRGNVTQVVPSRSVRNGPVVALTGTAKVERGVTVRLSGVRRITTKAEGPGEVAGPGVSVRVVVENSGSRVVSLRQFAITVESLADHRPATPLTARYTKTIATSVAAGRSATGDYAFTTGSTRSGVLVTVTYAATAPTARFVGVVR